MENISKFTRESKLQCQNSKTVAFKSNKEATKTIRKLKTVPDEILEEYYAERAIKGTMNINLKTVKLSLRT